MDVVIKRIFRFLIVKTTLKYVNIFEHTEIAEPIYEVVVEPSLKNNRVDDNCAGHSRKI